MQHLVLKLGGAVCADPATVTGLAATVRALQAHDVRVTIVHGGGPQLDAALRERFGEPVKHHGLRVTPPAAAETVRTVLDDIGAGLQRALEDEGLHVRHVPGRAGRLRATAKGIVEAVDLERVGNVIGFDEPEPAGPDVVTVVTPVGADSEGPLNVNADEGAAAIALALDADGLVLVTDVDAVRDKTGKGFRTLDTHQAEEAIESGAATGGMIPKLRGARTVLDAGVPWVWIGRLEADQILAAADGTHKSGTRVTAADPVVREAST